MIPAGSEIEVVSPPKDGISTVKFGNEGDHLITSSWDAVHKWASQFARLIRSL